MRSTCSAKMLGRPPRPWMHNLGLHSNRGWVIPCVYSVCQPLRAFALIRKVEVASPDENAVSEEKTSPGKQASPAKRATPEKKAPSRYKGLTAEQIRQKRLGLVLVWDVNNVLLANPGPSVVQLLCDALFEAMPLTFKKSPQKWPNHLFTGS